MRMVLMLAVSLLVACANQAPGTACEATGDGFTRHDPCRFHCVGWEVPCVDGSAVVPGVCSGDTCTSDDDCAAGFACGATHADAGACLPVGTCATGFAPGAWATP